MKGRLYIECCYTDFAEQIKKSDMHAISSGSETEMVGAYSAIKKEENRLKNSDYLYYEDLAKIKDEGYKVECCDASLLMLDETDMTIDYMIEQYSIGEQFPCILQFDPMSMSDDMASEMKGWILFSKKIIDESNNDPEKILSSVEAKSFTFEISDKSNCYLKDCKIYSIKSGDQLIIVVNKIIFFNK